MRYVCQPFKLLTLRIHARATFTHPNATVQTNLENIITMHISILTQQTNECNHYHLTECTKTHVSHPLLQEKYTGLETARLWKPFFLSFLAKTKREQPLPGQVYCEIWPHSLQFWLHNFSNFWVKIGALVRPHLSSWTGFDLPIISGVKF